MKGEAEQIESKELRARLDDPSLQLIDVRRPDAYNGWRLAGERRGGHVPGARSLPAKWAGYLDWIEIVRAKDIRPEDEVVLYGYDRPETERVAGRFFERGQSRVRIYDRFVEQWSAREDLPLQRLPRFPCLVPPEWVRDAAIHRRAPACGEPPGGPTRCPALRCPGR